MSFRINDMAFQIVLYSRFGQVAGVIRGEAVKRGSELIRIEWLP